MNLVDLPITREAYDALPLWTKDSRFAPKGARFRNDGSGRVLEMSGGDQLFSCQCAAMSPPEKGWRYYKPVFIEKNG